MADCIAKLAVLLLLITIFQKSCVFCSNEILLTKSVFVAENRETPNSSENAQPARVKEQQTSEPMNLDILISEQATGNEAANEAGKFLLKSSRLPVNKNDRDDSGEDNDDDDQAASLPLSADEAERLAIQLSQFDDRLEDEGFQSSAISAANLFDDSAFSPSLGSQLDGAQANDSLIKRGLSAPISELNNEFLTFFDEMWRLKNSSIRALARLEYFNQSLFPLKTGNNRAVNRDNLNFNRTRPNRQSFLQYISILNKSRVPSGTFQFKINKTSPSKRFPTSTTTTTSAGSNNLWPRNNMNIKRQMGNFTGQQSWPFNSLGGNNSSAGNELGSPTVGARLNSWLLQLNQKLSNALIALSSPLIGKFSSPTGTASKPPTFSAANVINAAAADDDERISGRLRSKRSSPPSTEDLVTGRSSHVQAPPATSTISPITSSGQRSASGSRTRPVKCAELDSGSLNKCRSTEALVHSSLNTSFPGTLMAIEDNCRHISFLLTSCWPKHLQQIQASLSASNKSMFALTDFPVPLSTEQTNRQRNKQSADALPSCGAPAAVPEHIHVRIDWMWVHLCMDKSFRHGYVENLKCLSLWNQRRAEAVCSNEFGRLQAMLSAPDGAVATPQPPQVVANNQLEPSDTGQTPFTGMAQGNSPAGSDVALINVTGQPILSNQQSAISSGSPSELGGELESKTLCCMFDLYLRCVHRQAIKDCGRAEGKFVVNFISRIGTDDLKDMCNGQMRPSQRHKHVTGSPPSANSGSSSNNNRRQQQSNANSESGLFIESNYCSDSRIYMAIYGAQHASAAGERNHFTPTSIAGSSGNLRPMNGGAGITIGSGNGGRTNNRGPIGGSKGDGINFDSGYTTDTRNQPAGFYGSDPETSGAGQATTKRLPSFTGSPLASSHFVTCLAVLVSWRLSTLFPLSHPLAG